jgi:predicted CopG family antitoxin
MQRRLTISISDDVYRGLHKSIGRGEISRFIEGLVRPYVVSTDELEAEYCVAADDTMAEQEATAWIQASVDDALD